MTHAPVSGARMRGVPRDHAPRTRLEDAGWCTLNLDDGDAVSRAALHDLFEHGLEQDNWLPHGHHYRRRAYQCFAVDLCTLQLDCIADPPAYTQAAEINSVAGGLRRAFRGVPSTHPATAVVRRLAAVVLQLTLDSDIATDDGRPYVLDAHFIRISAPGRPCPEGIHRDGLVAGSVHLIDLANVSGGMTHFSSAEGEPLHSLQLTRFLDSVIFDDRRLLHCTDDIAPRDPSASGHRDVLLLGLRETSI